MKAFDRVDHVILDEKLVKLNCEDIYLLSSSLFWRVEATQLDVLESSQLLYL